MIDNVRDILISVYLVAGIVLTLALLVFAFFVFLAVRGLIRTASRGVENLGKVSDAAVEHVVKPLEEGASVGSVAGNVVGFATGFMAGLRGRKAKREDDKDGKRRRRRFPWL